MQQLIKIYNVYSYSELSDEAKEKAQEDYLYDFCRSEALTNIYMEDLKKKMSADMNDKEIVFSKSIKAGKRIYYLDVKKNRKDEMFLAITESNKVIMGEGDDSQVSFEKHKIFLYREDFQKFMAGLTEAI